MRKVIIGVNGEDRHNRALGEALEGAIGFEGLCTIAILSDAFILPEEALFCPLTLQVPPGVNFPAKAVFQACQDVSGLRQRVQQWEYPIGMGQYWLPIVLTARGPLYAEAIALTPAQTYAQPFDLADRDRQPLYHLSYRLLKHLQATPGVYLLQFGFYEDRIEFDRLIPFPDLPALASLGVQSPDLFVCHWLCLTGQPLHDLTILPENVRITV